MPEFAGNFDLEFDEKLVEMVGYAYTKAPAFKYLFDVRGLVPADVRGTQHLRRIPVTRRADLVRMQREKPPFGGWLAVPESEIEGSYQLPGPIHVPKTPLDDNGAEALKQALQSAALIPGETALITLSYDASPAAAAFDAGLCKLGITVIASQDIGAAISEHKPTIYVGTPDELDRLYQKAEDLEIPLPTFKKALLTGEPCPDELRQKFEEQYQLTTTWFYGLDEFGLLAHERFGRKGLYVAENVLAEIVDPDTGRRVEDGTPGELVVTHFNRIFPVLRFGTDWLSAYETDVYGKRRLKGLLGRLSESIKVRGMHVHPNQVRQLAKQVSQFKQVAVIIANKDGQDVVKVQVLPIEGLKSSERDELADNFRTDFRRETRVRVDALNFVLPGIINPARGILRDDRR